MKLLFLAFASWLICVLVPAECAEWYVDHSVSASGERPTWQLLQGGVPSVSDAMTP